MWALAGLAVTQALSSIGVPALGATTMAAAGGLAGQGELRLWLTSGERLWRRWGPLTVVLTPSWVAGALGFPLRRFAAWNLLGAVMWTVGPGLAAYGVGFAIWSS